MCIEIKVETDPSSTTASMSSLWQSAASSPSPAKTKHSAWLTIDYSKEVKIQIEIQES